MGAGWCGADPWSSAAGFVTGALPPGSWRATDRARARRRRSRRRRASRRRPSDGAARLRGRQRWLASRDATGPPRSADGGGRGPSGGPSAPGRGEPGAAAGEIGRGHTGAPGRRASTGEGPGRPWRRPDLSWAARRLEGGGWACRTPSGPGEAARPAGSRSPPGPGSARRPGGGRLRSGVLRTHHRRRGARARAAGAIGKGSCRLLLPGACGPRLTLLDARASVGRQN